MTVWLDAWDRTTAGHRAEGRDWYPAMGTVVAAAGAPHGLPRLWSAGMAAALSPRMPWDRNLLALRGILARDGKVYHTRVQERAARRIMAGEHPLAVLQGPKVTAFALALAGDRSAVVLDTHVLAIVGYPPGTSLRRGVYRALASDLARAARRVGAHPAEFQATLWVWRRG